MPKQHFLGGWISTKCHKKCRFGICYKNIWHWQEWKNCKKCRFGTSYDLVHEKLPKVCKLKKLLPRYCVGFFFLVQLIFDLLNNFFYIFSTQNLIYYSIFNKINIQLTETCIKIQKRYYLWHICRMHKVTKKTAI